MTTEDILHTMKRYNIAIVGNGSIIEQGLEIDSHDIIVRFNRYETKGFENHVGSKITHLVTCRKKYTHGRFMKMFKVFCPYSRNCLKVKDISIICYSKSDWVSKLPFKINKPTSGSLLLFIFHSMGIHINVYGFDFLKSGHYWDNSYQHQPVHSEEEKMETFLLKSEYINFIK